MAKPTDYVATKTSPFANTAGQRVQMTSGKFASGYGSEEHPGPRQLNDLLGNLFDHTHWLDTTISTPTYEIAAPGFRLVTGGASLDATNGDEWSFPTTSSATLVAELDGISVGQTLTSILWSINPGTPSLTAVITLQLNSRAAGGASSTIASTTIVNGAGGSYTTKQLLGANHTVAAGERLYLRMTTNATAIIIFSTAPKLDGVKIVAPWA